MSFFKELRRRNVFRVGIAYLIGAWLLLQVADVLMPMLALPDWTARLVLLLLALGLPLALFFAWAFELTPEGLKKEKDVDRSQSITHNTGRKLDYAIITVLTLALAYFAWDYFVVDPRSESGSIPGNEPRAGENEAATSAAVVQAEKSIAVLPFADMSPDQDQEYFSDGISEEILNALARVSGLKVAGRTSSFAFKGRNEDLRVIGEALGVGHVLEGSVRKAGNKLRITAQLIKADDGFHMWSETYDRDMDDVFAIQDEIASAILEQMKLHLMGQSASSPVAVKRGNIEAYNLFLTARQNINKREEEEMALAARQLDEAIRLDPDYAPALALRAIAALLLTQDNYGDLEVEQARAQARSLIDKALALDDNLAEAYEALGFFYLDTDPNLSGQMLEKALGINPSLLNARNWLHINLRDRGRYTESLEVLEELAALDPLYPPGIISLNRIYLISGEFERQKALLDRTLLHLPSNLDSRRMKVANLVGLGRYADAIEIALEYKESEDDPIDLVYANVLLELGEWQQVLDIGFAFQVAEAYRRLGQYEEARHLIENGIRKGDRASVMIQLLTEQERYAELIAWMEQNWPDIDRFEREYNLTNYLGSRDLVDLAWAYRQQGNMTKFEELMDRVDATTGELLKINAAHPEFLQRRAYAELVRGNVDNALDFLEQADAKHWSTPIRLSREKPAYAALDGHPRYEALLQKWFAHVNAERNQLGLQPLEPGSTL